MGFEKIIGIDPGKSGCIAIFDGSVVEVHKMPEKAKGIMQILQDYKDAVCFIERINTFRGDKGGKQFRIEKLLRNHQSLKDVLDMLDIPFIEVHPSTWQKALHLKVKFAEETTVKKNRFKRMAQKKFPQIKCTLWNSDALLILSYGYWQCTMFPGEVNATLKQKDENNA